MMSRSIASGALVLLLVVAAGCGDTDEGAGDAGDDGGTDSPDGTVEVTGNWDGAAPAGTGFRVSLFACPFSMPPDYFQQGTFDADSGEVDAVISEVEPGEWCLMAYVDMDPDDGLAPVGGLDAVNASGDENEWGAIPLEVTAGQTTAIDLVFAI
ncbi:MAG TPA: hypothetical protein VM389_07170 [Phycisphaerae bacterium]|nr:hypothetical protein [Phycisphaerae bacterium]